MHSTCAPADTVTPDIRTWLALGVVLSALFMSQIDLFIINVAIPSIQRDLGATFGESQFFIDGYVIAYAAFLVLGGRLGDRCGRKRLFGYGVLAFTFERGSVIITRAQLPAYGEEPELLCLKLTFLNPLTRLQDIDDLLEEIRSAALEALDRIHGEDLHMVDLPA
ncbi:MAG: MFS transporter [Pseudonocardia sp.]|nr:MFS transporter [Pseudonocardia sp.]